MWPSTGVLTHCEYSRSLLQANQYCKSRIFRMYFIFAVFIFVYFVRGGFRPKIKCVLNLQSKAENPQRLAAVRKFYASEKVGGHQDTKVECVRNILDFQYCNCACVHCCRHTAWDSEIHRLTSFDASLMEPRSQLNEQSMLCRSRFHRSDAS